MVEIVGKVTKIGRIKDYGHDANFGKEWIPIYKFFMEVDTKEKGLVNAMVECNADRTEYGYKIPKNDARQKPFIGDVVKFSTRQLKDKGTKWASVTFNQTFEIIEENQDARKEREEFIAKKKTERKDEYLKKVEEGKKRDADRKQARFDELERQRNDDVLPESVRKEITQTFDRDRILSILRDTAWFTMEEGEGGKRASYTISGAIIEDGYPGTGMRRPGGPLHHLPASFRKSVLSKAVKSGLITETDRGYMATNLGIKLLVKLDTCPVCNELRIPYHGTGHYSTPWYVRHDDIGICYHCKHEINETYKHQSGSNCGTTYAGYKKTDEQKKKLLEIAGAENTPTTVESNLSIAGE